MRGSTGPQIRLATPEQLVPRDHPTPQIKPIVDAVPRQLDPVFEIMYSDLGRPSIPPETRRA